MSLEMNHFVCTQCAVAYAEAGLCTQHPDEPLLDGRKETVVEFLSGLDAARLRKKLVRITVGLGLVFIVIGIMALMLVVPDADERRGDGLIWSVILGYTVVLSFFTRKVIKNDQPLYETWTNEAHLRPGADQVEEILGHRVQDVRRRAQAGL